MVVLGIDPGLANVGWGVIEADSSSFSCLDYGVIKTSADMAHCDRLDFIYSSIYEVCQRFSPVIAGVESLYFAKNKKSAFMVAEAKGVLLLALRHCRVSTFELTPLEIKQSLTSSGRADKAQIQMMVKLLLGLDKIPKPDHAADALAAGIAVKQLADFKGRIDSV